MPFNASRRHTSGRWTNTALIIGADIARVTRHLTYPNNEQECVADHAFFRSTGALRCEQYTANAKAIRH